MAPLHRLPHQRPAPRAADLSFARQLGERVGGRICAHGKESLPLGRRPRPLCAARRSGRACAVICCAGADEKTDVRSTAADDVLASLSLDEEYDSPDVASIAREVSLLKSIVEELGACSGVEEKCAVLRSTPRCRSLAVGESAWMDAVLRQLGPAKTFALLSVVAIGQEHVLGDIQAEMNMADLDRLAASLLRLEKFYDSLGGVLGYQIKSLELIGGGLRTEDECGGGGEGKGLEYLMPACLDLSEDGDVERAREAVAHGVECVPAMAEIYALGGAGDRLGLQCRRTGEALPAAMLPYCGRTMLDSLLRDLQAREYLHFRIFGHQATTPVAIMTSDAKGNHWRITDLLERRGWYGRGPEAFRLFKQPLVPVLRIPDGRWLISAPCGLVTKPGGHGVIWKLMQDEGVFDWFAGAGRTGALVRQISNPMAGMDTTLFGLSGVGEAEGRSMGFASCERVVGASEGMNVLQHRRVCREGGNGNGTDGSREAHEYGVTNIEYTEFERLGITDVAVSSESTTSCFPANTNILYVGLRAARDAVRDGTRRGGGAALPGLIFNMKKVVKYLDAVEGVAREEHAGRMECMMQNLADSLVDVFDEELDASAHGGLSTFMVSNERRKVTSSAKKKRKPGAGNVRQTPEGSFWDLMGNAEAVLRGCGADVPKLCPVEQYLAEGPNFLFLFHPALGPLWSVIASKLRGGRLAQGSELVLEIAEAKLADVDVFGSLIVHAAAVVGHVEERGGDAESSASDLESASSNGDASEASSELLQRASAGDEPALASDCCSTSERLVFSDRCGRARLEGVEIRNDGVDWADPDNVFWQHKVARRQSCRVLLRGNSEFDARDVTIVGDHVFDVPDGCRMVVRQGEGGRQDLVTTLEPVGESPAWRWTYRISQSHGVALSVEELSSARL